MSEPEAVTRARTWIPLHRNNPYQAEAAKIMNRLLAAYDELAALPGPGFDEWLAAHDREVAARALRELHAEMSEWEGYDTRDIGWAFLADSVLEHIDEKRAELEGEDENV